MNMEEIRSEMASSSAQSFTQTLKIGGRQVETMKGTKLTHLSPITRRMNKIAMKTISQIENHQTQMKVRDELRETLRARMP